MLFVTLASCVGSLQSSEGGGCMDLNLFILQCRHAWYLRTVDFVAFRVLTGCDSSNNRSMSSSPHSLNPPSKPTAKPMINFTKARNIVTVLRKFYGTIKLQQHPDFHLGSRSWQIGSACCYFHTWMLENFQNPGWGWFSASKCSEDASSLFCAIFSGRK